MNIIKDRYTQAALLGITGATTSVIFFRKNDESKLFAIGLIIMIVAIIYLYFIASSSSKLHLTEEQKEDLENGELEIKTENGCGFKAQYSKHIDGVKINGTRYKAVNGTDVYIKNNEVKSCGPGTAFMQSIGKGGIEPKSIQQDECW